MKLNSRPIVRLLVASLYSIPFAAFAASPSHTKAASIQNETVFVVQDATNASKCTIWKGDPSNVQPCPAGSVIWSYPLTRSSAESRHLDYVVLTADSIATVRAVAMEADRLHKSLAASAPSAPASADAYRTTDAAREMGVSPNVTWSTGGQYQNQDGNSISYWVGWNPTPQNNITSVVSSAKMYGCCTNWKEDDIQSMGATTTFSRNCMALTGSWSAQQGLPGTFQNGAQYQNWSSTCGLFPHDAYGYTNLYN